jgi:hypothetical protein
MIRKNRTGNYQSERSTVSGLFYRGMKLLTLFVVASTLLASIQTRTNSAKSPASSRGAVIVKAAGRGKGLLNPHDGRALSAEYGGETTMSQALRAGFAQPLTLASADFDHDGAPDLITGYRDGRAGILTLQRGNVDAFVPKDRTIYDRAAKGDLPPSFVNEVRTFQLPETPDVLLVGDFNDDGRKDLLTATRGGDLYLLVGDGAGSFDAPEQLELPGTVTALTAGTFTRAEGLRAVIAGVMSPQGPALAVFNQDSSGLSRTPTMCPLPAQATALVLGSFDEDSYFDLAATAANEVVIFHGSKPGAPISDGRPMPLQSRMERIDLSFNALSLAAGTFAPDGVPRMDLAMLSSDGAIHLLQRRTQKVAQAANVSEQFPGLSPYEVRDEMRKRFVEEVKASASVPMWQPDTKQDWTEVRQLDVTIAPPGPDAPAALLTTSNVSARGADDLLLIDAAQQHVHVLVNDVSKRLGSGAATDSLSRSSYTAVSLDTEAPVAVLPMPQKINGERDLMILSGAHSTAARVPLLPNGVTLTVNTNSDLDRSPGTPNSQCNGSAGDCSLREAVLKANVNIGPNTINVPGNIGTYNLSINNPNNPGGTGTMAFPDIEIGSATNTNTTLIGTLGTPKIVQTIALNDVITTGFTTLPFPANAADVTLGLQNLEITGGTFTGIFTGADDGAGHIANTTITNCNVHNNTNGGSDASGTFGQGGGLQNQCGTLSIQSSTFANNAATNANTAQGGAIYYAIINAAGQCSTGDFTVTNSTFTSNTAAVKAGFPAGGAMFISGGGSTAIPISGTTFTSNLANGGGDGGAIASSTATRTVNVTTSTFTTNHASTASGHGGAIENQSGPLNVNFCRFIGNTATTAANGQTLALIGGTFNGSKNWFGSNTGPTANDIFGAVTTTPFLKLRNVVSGANVHNVNQIAPSTSATFTADIRLLSDNTVTAASNLTGLDTFPAAPATIYSNAVLGTIPGGQTGQFVDGVAPPITYTAGATKGSGSLDASVDGVTATGSVIIGFTPEWVNTGGGNDVNSAFASAACGGGNTPCFNTVALALTNVAVTGLIHIQTGTYAENPNFNQNCTTQIDGNTTVNALTLTNGTFNAQSFTTTLASANFTNDGGTFTQGTSTFNFSPGVGAQSIGGTQQTTFNNLTINNASGVNLSNSETVGGILTLTSGALGVGTNTLTLNGAVSFASGSFTSGATGTVNYNQSSNGQGVAPGSYGNLTFSNFNKTLAATGTIGIAGTFTPGTAVGHTITGSTVDFNGAGAQTVLAPHGPTGSAGPQAVASFNYNNLTISGNRGGAAITLSGSIGVAGTFSPTATNNTYTTTGSTVIFNGSALQSVPAFSFDGLTLNNAAGANLGGDVTVGAGLTLTAGALGVGTNTLTLNGSASTGGGTLTSGTTGTVNYNQGSSGQATVLAANYGNLTFSNFNKTLASGGTIGIAGTFTPGTGAAHTITGSTINFNGAGAQTIPGFTYNNLTSSGGAVGRTLDPVNTIKIAGAFTPGTNTYTITGSTIEYNGSSAQSLPSSGFNTYNNLTLNNGAGTSGFAGLTVNGLIEVKAGTFTSSSSYNNVQIDSGATLAATAGSTINVSGNWTNNGGTFTPSTGTVNLNGAGSQTIGGTGTTTFNNLTVSNTNNISMLNDNTVNGVLALTGADITVAATKTLTQPVGGSSSGGFDVNGRLQRTGFISGGAALSFGNPFNTIQVTAGTAPANIVVDLSRSAPAGFSTAVQRTYAITPSAGGFTGTLRLHYLDAELNGNAEGAGLLLRRFNGSGWAPVTPSTFDTSANWAEKTGVTTFSPWAFSSCCSPTVTNGVVGGRITDGNGAPVAGAVVNLSGTQTRKMITDANGRYQFDNVDTSGFYTVTPSRTNYNFSPASRSFTQEGNKTEAAFTGSSMGDSANPVDTPEYFVRQQYVDVLGREPDEAGFNYWSDQLLACGEDTQCVNAERRDVAAAFFISDEYQASGSYIYDLYAGALGRRPGFAEYSADRAQVVGGANLDTAKNLFAQNFVQRNEFTAKYQDALGAESFVDALLQSVQSSGGNLSGERSNLIGVYNQGTDLASSRAAVIRSLADNAAFKQTQYNQAFVLTEYFAYLRRDIDLSGYNFWVNVLNTGDPGNYRGMVCSFVTSREYQNRFGQIVSHSNGECGN